VFTSIEGADFYAGRTKLTREHQCTIILWIILTTHSRQTLTKLVTIHYSAY